MDYVLEWFHYLWNRLNVLFWRSNLKTRLPMIVFRFRRSWTLRAKAIAGWAKPYSLIGIQETRSVSTGVSRTLPVDRFQFLREKNSIQNQDDLIIRSFCFISLLTGLESLWNKDSSLGRVMAIASFWPQMTSFLEITDPFVPGFCGECGS